MKNHIKHEIRERSRDAIIGMTRNIPGRLSWLRHVFRPLLPLLANSCPDPIFLDVLGFRMELRPANSLFQRGLVFYPQLMDQRSRRFLRRNLKAGDVFVDAGSHVGFYALDMASVVGPGGSVVAIEAAPNTYEQLVRNIEINALSGRVIPVLAALTGEEGSYRIIENRGNTGSSRVVRDLMDDGLRPGRSPRVEGATLTSIVGDGAVDAMKLDIEGMEAPVLMEFLDSKPVRTWPRAILVEDNPELRHGFVDELLTRHGYVAVMREHLNVGYVRPNHRN